MNVNINKSNHLFSSIYTYYEISEAIRKEIKQWETLRLRKSINVLMINVLREMNRMRLIDAIDAVMDKAYEYNGNINLSRSYRILSTVRSAYIA